MATHERRRGTAPFLAGIAAAALLAPAFARAGEAEPPKAEPTKAAPPKAEPPKTPPPDPAAEELERARPWSPNHPRRAIDRFPIEDEVPAFFDRFSGRERPPGYRSGPPRGGLTDDPYQRARDVPLPPYDQPAPFPRYPGGFYDVPWDHYEFTERGYGDFVPLRFLDRYLVPGTSFDPWGRGPDGGDLYGHLVHHPGGFFERNLSGWIGGTGVSDFYFLGERGFGPFDRSRFLPVPVQDYSRERLHEIRQGPAGGRLIEPADLGREEREAAWEETEPQSFRESDHLPPRGKGRARLTTPSELPAGARERLMKEQPEAFDLPRAPGKESSKFQPLRPLPPSEIVLTADAPRARRGGDDDDDDEANTSSALRAPGAEPAEPAPPETREAGPGTAGEAGAKDRFSRFYPTLPEEAVNDLVTLSTKDLLARGDLWFLQSNYKGASVAYALAVLREPGNFYPRLAFSHSLFALGEFRISGEELRFATELNPSFTEKGLDLAAIFRRAEEFQALRRALEAHPSDRAGEEDVRLLLGYVLRFGGEPGRGGEILDALAGDAAVGKAARALLGKAGEKDPGSGKRRSEVASDPVPSPLPDSAIRVPQFPSARYRDLIAEGDGRFRAGDYPAAEKAYAAAQAEDDGYFLGHFAVGHARFARGDFAGAAAALRRGFEAYPEWTRTRMVRRNFYGDPLEYDRQMGALERHAALHPEDVSAAFVLGYNLFFSDRPARARGPLSVAPEGSADRAAARLLLAATPAIDLQGAPFVPAGLSVGGAGLAPPESGAATHPDVAGAALKFRSGNLAGARERLRERLLKAPADRDALYLYAEVLLAGGEFEKGGEAVRRAVEAGPVRLGRIEPFPASADYTLKIRSLQSAVAAEGLPAPALLLGYERFLSGDFAGAGGALKSLLGDKTFGPAARSILDAIESLAGEKGKLRDSI